MRFVNDYCVELGLSTSCIPYVPEQHYMMLCALQNWLPAAHLAYFINDTVSSLNLSAFYARYASGGSRNPPFHLSMMIEVLVYAYTTGRFSSRKIARKLHKAVAFSARTAEKAFRPTARSVTFLPCTCKSSPGYTPRAREIGLVKLGIIAIDGTKVKATASCH